MNNVDKQYLNLLQDILDNGVVKNTRAGVVKSVFGRQMRFNLKEGLPILTTKKVFVKGIIHELLWFLRGDTNIKYLVDNNVHIWDDDAYRHYLDLCKKNDVDAFDKDSFIKMVKIELVQEFDGLKYTFGDLGPVYGHQWRNQGVKQIDQIQQIINTLKTNPDDRRMICMAWNANDFEDMALPPCHYGFQVYTRELTSTERLDWLCEHSNGEYDEYKSPTSQLLDKLGVPQRELSLMFNMRSNDFCCGNPYNIAQYGMLAYILCEVCNMTPGELVFNGGDVHVYENQMEGAMEQLSRTGSDKIPTLRFGRKINNINDFEYDDFIIENYYPDAPIKYPLNVGL